MAATPQMTIANVNAIVNQAKANISDDPTLDATSHLKAGSKCIDQGTATEAPMRDIDGEKRPKGAAIDIGADEAG